MSLIPRSLVTEWQNTISQLNKNSSEGGLAKTCHLILKGQLEIDSNIQQDTIGQKPTSVAGFGGRSGANNLTGHDITDSLTNVPAGGVKETEITKVIQARVYPINKPSVKLTLGVEITANVWQMHTAKENMPDILRCMECILNVDLVEKRTRVRLLKPPMAYGLAENFECISFWTEIQ